MTVIRDNNIIFTPSPAELIRIRRDAAIYAAVARARPVRGEHRRRDIIIYAVTAVCAYRVARRDNSGGALPGERTELRVRGLDGPPRCISRVSRVTLARTASYSRDERAM